MTLCFCWLMGCNQTSRLYEFTLKGTISLGTGTAGNGKVFIELYHKQTGVGNLQQPLLFVQSLEVNALGEFSKTIEFPIEEERSGLVLYAWYDANDDGNLCSTQARDELSGLVDIPAFPKRNVTLTLILDKICLGPEALYPP